MHLGFFMMPVHPPGRELWATLEEDTEKSLLADRLGFEELWMGEHYTATSEPIPSPFMFLAGLVARTRNLRFGTAVVNLPNHHPAIVAAEAAQFDNMSRGRFTFGIGPGGLLSDFELFRNFDPQVRIRKLAEAMDIIEHIWTHDPPYDLQGEYWSVQIKDAVMPDLGVGFMPKPYQKPVPPTAIALSSPHSPTAALAAQRGWGIISANLIPTYSVASHWTVYSKACAEKGVPARGENWRVSRNVMVAPSDSEAQDRVFGAAASNRYYFTYIHGALSRVGYLQILKPDPSMSDADTTPEVIMTECVIHGSPKTVLDKLVAFRERVGPFGTLLMTGLDWDGPNEAYERDAMRLLAQEVMPKFRQHVLAQAAE